jgi:hypothetical protein
MGWVERRQHTVWRFVTHARATIQLARDTTDGCINKQSLLESDVSRLITGVPSSRLEQAWRSRCRSGTHPRPQTSPRQSFQQSPLALPVRRQDSELSPVHRGRTAPGHVCSRRRRMLIRLGLGRTADTLMTVSIRRQTQYRY